MELLKTVSVFLVVAGHNHVQGEQSFLEEPQSVISAPGGSVTFTCLVQNKGGECRWQKDGKPVGMYPGKYELSKSEGDCSISIRDVDIRIDDGDWQCQVTGTSFVAMDALASRTARLTVEIAPESVSVQYNHVGVEESVKVREGVLETISCVTRHSNPAPLISWYLGDKQLVEVEQRNSTERQMSDRWRSEAVLTHKFGVQDTGSVLRCVVTHAGYAPRGHNELLVSVDVMYKPIVTITREDSDDQLEEGVGHVKLTCNVNSNPGSSIVWSRLDTRTGQHNTVHNGEQLMLKPVRRENAGTYICTASNSVGQSDPGQTVIDVLYPPVNVRTSPSSHITVSVHNRTRLLCKADGNPTPKYQWVQNSQVRSYSDYLELDNVGYSDQGEYHCVATNIIGGERKEIESAGVTISVTGAPQVVRQSGGVIGLDGGDVRLEAELCSDPSPSETSWTWADVVLPSGGEMEDGRYRAELLSHPQLENCYISRLTVKSVDHRDARSYHVSVTNMHGSDSAPVHLTIRAPVPVTSAIAAAGLLIVILILIGSVCLVCKCKKKLCFKEEKEISPNNTFSNKAESKVSLVNETKDNRVATVSPIKLNPHSTKV